LKSWAESGWLKPHRTSAAETAALLAAIDDDLANAGKDLSPAWQFNIAYSAALGACTVLLAAAGYRAARDNKHYRTIAALPLILGPDTRELADFLDHARKMRHDVTYEGVRATSEEEARELIDTVITLRETLLKWLRKNRPELLG
jgi:hypothetical protein